MNVTADPIHRLEREALARARTAARRAAKLAGWLRISNEAAHEVIARMTRPKEIGDDRSRPGGNPT